MEYLSLYDYLGKPAGLKLGAEVKTEADLRGVPFKMREISNPKYEGKVLLYPKDFLEFYFREPEVEPTLGDRQDFDDDLPF
jgi:hypothetical protein